MTVKPTPKDKISRQARNDNEGSRGPVLSAVEGTCPEPAEFAYTGKISVGKLYQKTYTTMALFL